MPRDKSNLAGRARRWLTLAFPATILAFATPVRAALVVSVQSVTVNAGSTGDALNVTLTNTGTTSVGPIGGFAFEIMVASPPITFTAVNTSTTPSTYIFGANSTYGPDISLTITPSSLGAEDNYNPATAGVMIGAGSTVGLGHVLFNVSSTASGMIPVTLFGLNSATNLSGPAPNSAAIPISSLSNGTITVAGSAVPAPSSLLMGLVAMASLISVRSIWSAVVRAPARPSRAM